MHLLSIQSSAVQCSTYAPPIYTIYFSAAHMHLLSLQSSALQYISTFYLYSLVQCSTYMHLLSMTVYLQPYPSHIPSLSYPIQNCVHLPSSPCLVYVPITHPHPKTHKYTCVCLCVEFRPLLPAKCRCREMQA